MVRQDCCRAGQISLLYTHECHYRRQHDRHRAWDWGYQTRHVIVPDLDHHVGMETMSGEIWAPPPSLCKLVSQRLQVGDASSLFQCARFRTLYEGEGINIPGHMQSRPDWYGSEWTLKGLELNQVFTKSLFMQYILLWWVWINNNSCTVTDHPPHHLEYFHRRFVARSMY